MSDDPKKTDEPTPDDTPGTVGRPLLTQEDRIAALIDEAAKRSPPQLAEFLLKASPILVPVTSTAVFILNWVGPLYFKLGQFIYWFLSSLPWDLLQAVLGLCLCFFGGGYCATIAAAEAFLMHGWPTTHRNLLLVYEDVLAMHEAQTADDKKDDDGDGIADVKQIPAAELVDRKIRVAAQAVKDPQRLATAIGGLYTGWLSVQAVLRIKFARTIQVAVTCATFVEYYAVKALMPMLTPFVGKEVRKRAREELEGRLGAPRPPRPPLLRPSTAACHTRLLNSPSSPLPPSHSCPRQFVHWLPTVISSWTRAFFVYWAWKMQEVVSAFQSGLRGGLMFSRGLMNYLNKKGFKKFFFLSLEGESSHVDEIVGYAIAALGVYVQWNLGFGMPFPVNIIMWPMDIVEWYIRVEITKEPV